MYVCGPTVYNYAHIGNARPAVVFDLLFRLLRRNFGADHVVYARNITDIDDKMMAAAAERGVKMAEVAAEFEAAYLEDMSALGVMAPTMDPHATHHIQEMIDLAAKLIASGNAYAADGHVLFNVPSFAEYGELSCRSRDEQIAGARVDVAPYKQDPADFVLWKPSRPDQEGWDSPWGFGRPGWHLECSAMAAAHLGKVFDIHGGGADLKFPHHENEIAQSRCAHDTDVMANYWMHNGYLMAEGEKMSKSLGNFYTINELLQEFPGEAIRLLLLKTHYRQPSDFTKEGLAEAKRELDGFYQALRQSSAADDSASSEPSKIIDALCDDLNTPKSISLLHEMLGQINRGDASAQHTLRANAAILGLLQQDPEEWFKWSPPSKSNDGLSDDDIEAKIIARNEARANKDFAASDVIRDELQAAGIILEDSAAGTIWRRG